MPDEHGREKARVQPFGVLQCVHGRVLSFHSQVDRRVSHRQVEIDQKRALLGFLGQRHGKVAGQGGDAGTAFGAQEYEQAAVSLLQGASRRATRRGPNQSLAHCAVGKRHAEKLASAGAHAADHQIRIGLLRTNHDDYRALDTDVFDQIQGQLRIAVQVNDCDIAVSRQRPHIVEARGIGCELPDRAILALHQGACHRATPPLIWTDYRDGQGSSGKHVGNVECGSHEPPETW